MLGVYSCHRTAKLKKLHRDNRNREAPEHHSGCKHSEEAEVRSQSSTRKDELLLCAAPLIVDHMVRSYCACAGLRALLADGAMTLKSLLCRSSVGFL